MTHNSREVLTRPAPGPDFTISYGEQADQVADVRLPRTQAPTGAAAGRASALILFFHGGFWRSAFDRAHTGPLAAALAEAGYLVATPEYRRTGAPGGGWPGTFDDVAEAARLVPGQVAARLGDAAPARLVIAGHSAGGQLALWAATRPSTPPVHAVVALAPVADLRTAYDLDLDEGAVVDLLGGGPAEVAERFALADPMALTPIGARLRLLHGDQDPYVPLELSRRFAERAAEAGDDVTLVELAGADHFALIDPLAPAWASVLRTFRDVAPPANPTAPGPPAGAGVDAGPDNG